MKRIFKIIVCSKERSFPNFFSLRLYSSCWCAPLLFVPSLIRFVFIIQFIDHIKHSSYKTFKKQSKWETERERERERKREIERTILKLNAEFQMHMWLLYLYFVLNNKTMNDQQIIVCECVFVYFACKCIKI